MDIIATNASMYQPMFTYVPPTLISAISFVAAMLKEVLYLLVSLRADTKAALAVATMEKKVRIRSCIFCKYSSSGSDNRKCVQKASYYCQANWRGI
mmetsp:Transcript_15553/g.22966  ORF Transcript_15553/g.22966 Transcript_15553/m.22966 type:complete len:96 (+) Transcript_15553:603-890(+)